MTAKYQRIVDALLAEIDDKQPGDKIESELELSERFQVSRMTIRQALQVLTFMGKITGIRGKGTFVANPRIRKSGTQGASFTEVLSQQSVTPSTRVLRVREMASPPMVALELGLEEGARVFEVKRLRLGDDVPLCIETSYLARARYPDLGELNLELSLYELLKQHYRVSLHHADVRFAARRASGEESELLGIRAGSPVMSSESTTRDEHNRAIEFTESIYRGDRYEFHVTSTIGG